jgi:hypothetical protein
MVTEAVSTVAGAVSMAQVESGVLSRAGNTASKEAWESRKSNGPPKRRLSKGGGISEVATDTGRDDNLRPKGFRKQLASGGVRGGLSRGRGGGRCSGGGGGGAADDGGEGDDNGSAGQIQFGDGTTCAKSGNDSVDGVGGGESGVGGILVSLKLRGQ